MSLLINPASQGTLLEIKAKTDNLPDAPADESTSTGIQTQTDKLAGADPVTDSATEDWQTAEADVVSIGAADIRNKVHDLSLNISNLVGTIIDIARQSGLTWLEAELFDKQQAAIRMFGLLA